MKIISHRFSLAHHKSGQNVNTNPRPAYFLTKKKFFLVLNRFKRWIVASVEARAS